MRAKSASLTFRGFEIPAEDVARLAAIPASRLGNRGEPVKPGVKTLLTRSYILFSMDFASDADLNEMLPTLVARLGGVQKLLAMREEVRPEFLEFHIDLPTRTSEDSQDGYLLEAVIADLFRLNATISFAFF